MLTSCRCVQTFMKRTFFLNSNFGILFCSLPKESAVMLKSEKKMFNKYFFLITLLPWDKKVKKNTAKEKGGIG